MTRTAQARGMRQEIQALRAVAVLAVVIFHLFPSRLTGGFVGVDVFFVISGFLITSHLLREVAREGTIRLGRFWARRIRRLLPAAFTVLVFALVGTLVILPWSEWKQGLREIIASALYFENWALAADSVDYLAAENSASLVQHYWSLSVEEQFYVFWPLLIMTALLISRVLKRSGKAQKQTILWVLVFVCVSSLVTSVLWTEISSASAYFVTPTRAWEFAVGGLLAFLPSRFAAPPRTPSGTKLHLIVGWGGLAAIIYSVVKYDSSVPFPSFTALLPVIGTAAVIWAADNDSVWSATLLGRSGPVQWIGEISYSLYLWHWPLVVLYPVVAGHAIGLKGGVALFVIMLAIAWISKKLIEDPFRSRNFWSAPARSYGFAITGMVAISSVAIASVSIIDSKIEEAQISQAPYGSLEELQSEVDATLGMRSWPIPDQVGGRDAQAEEWVVDNCIDVDSESARERCVYGDASSEKTMVVIGDSFATHLLQGLRGAFGDEYRILPLTLSQCPVVDVAVVRSGSSEVFEECQSHNEKNLGLIQQISPDVVIVADATVTTFNRMYGIKGSEDRSEIYREAVDHSYDDLAQAYLGRIVMIESPPNANCKPRNGFTGPRDCNDEKPPATTRALQEFKLESAEEHGFVTVDMMSWTCDEGGTCPTLIGNTLTRADGGHLSSRFSARLSNIFKAEVGPKL